MNKTTQPIQKTTKYQIDLYLDNIIRLFSYWPIYQAGALTTAQGVAEDS